MLPLGAGDLATAGVIAGTAVARGGADRDTKTIQEISAVQLLLGHGSSSLRRSGANAPATLGARTSGLFSGLLQHPRPSGPPSKSTLAGSERENRHAGSPPHRRAISFTRRQKAYHRSCPPRAFRTVHFRGRASPAAMPPPRLSRRNSAGNFEFGTAASTAPSGYCWGPRIPANANRAKRGRFGTPCIRRIRRSPRSP